MIKRLELNVYKKLNPSIIELADALSKLTGVDRSRIILREMDKGVQNVKVIVEGSGIDYGSVKETIGSYDGEIHSVGKVDSGKKYKVDS